MMSIKYPAWRILVLFFLSPLLGPFLLAFLPHTGLLGEVKSQDDLDFWLIFGWFSLYAMVFFSIPALLIGCVAVWNKLHRSKKSSVILMLLGLIPGSFFTIMMSPATLFSQNSFSDFMGFFGLPIFGSLCALLVSLVLPKNNDL